MSPLAEMYSRLVVDGQYQLRAWPLPATYFRLVVDGVYRLRAWPLPETNSLLVVNVQYAVVATAVTDFVVVSLAVLVL